MQQCLKRCKSSTIYWKASHIVSKLSWKHFTPLYLSWYWSYFHTFSLDHKNVTFILPVKSNYLYYHTTKTCWRTLLPSPKGEIILKLKSDLRRWSPLQPNKEALVGKLQLCSISVHESNPNIKLTQRSSPDGDARSNRELRLQSYSLSLFSAVGILTAVFWLCFQSCLFLILEDNLGVKMLGGFLYKISKINKWL